MKYDTNEIPIINQKHDYTEGKNKIISSFATNTFKLFYCEPNIFREVLSYVDGINSFKSIQEKFEGRYSPQEVDNFLRILLDENVIKIQKSQFLNLPTVLVIGSDKLIDFFKNIDKCVTVEQSDFLNEKNIDDFDAYILAISDCTYDDLLKFNEKLYRCNKPYILFDFNGEDSTLGPLVIPKKTSCLECVISNKLKNINLDLTMEEKVKISDLGPLKYVCDTSLENNDNLIPYLVYKAYDEIVKQYNNKTSELVNHQYFFKKEFLNPDTKKVLPTTHCDFCRGMNKKYINIVNENDLKTYLEREEFSLSNNSIKYSTGGLRSKSEEETRAILDNELKKLGAKIRIEFDEGNPFRDIAPSFSSYCEAIDSEYIYVPEEERGAGKGMTKSQAYFSAGFEIIEHITRQHTGDIPIISAKYKDIKNYAIDMKYMAKTIMNEHTSYDKFDENIDMDWIIGRSVLTDEKKLIPAFLAFMFDIDVKGTLFGATSTGVASGTTIEDAILHGLLEVIEHDAWIIGQSNPYVLPIVNYSSSNNIKIKEAVSKIKDMGYDIVTRDYTNDLGIPVFRTYITNRKNFSQYSYNGIGCHILPELALERSITEAIQFCDPLFGGSDSSLITGNVLSTSLVSLYNQHYVINKDVLGQTERKTKIGQPIFDFESSYDVIKKLAHLVKEKIGGDVYYLELTKPGMEVKVVRTIVTGDIQRMHHPIISVSNRLFEFGIRCGYSNRLMTYEELFMGMYQH